MLINKTESVLKKKNSSIIMQVCRRKFNCSILNVVRCLHICDFQGFQNLSVEHLHETTKVPNFPNERMHLKLCSDRNFFCIDYNLIQNIITKHNQ